MFGLKNLLNQILEELKKQTTILQEIEKEEETPKPAVKQVMTFGTPVKQ